MILAMDNKYIVKEIEKYLVDVMRIKRPLSKIVKKDAIKELIPMELRAFKIDEGSIRLSSVDDALYKFSAKGKISFKDKTSNVSIVSCVEFHGVARLVNANSRSYVDAVEIASLPKTSEILSSVIKSSEI